MAEIINYIWQSSFCLLFFFGVYWCFLKNEKAFTLTRVFILIAPILALLFPLIEIPVDFAKPNISLEHTDFLQSLTAFSAEEEVVGTFGLPEFTVKGTKLPLLLELRDYLIIGYLAIVLILGMVLYWRLLQLRMLLRKGWYQTSYQLKGNYFLVPTFGMAPVFSFFDKLFWDDTQQLRPDEKHHIFKHEIEHIRQGHSWDVIYYQILGILFWFNPAIHLMRSALVDTHEYLADAHVLKRTDNKESYKKLMVKIAFKGLDLPIGNYFIRSTTLKRIMMMKKSSKINWFKLVMILPLTAMLLGLVSMKTTPDPNFLKENTVDNLLMIKKYVTENDSINVTTQVKKIDFPVHYEYVSRLKKGKITAQIGELQYEIGDISDKEEYRKVLEMIQILKQNAKPNKDRGKIDLEKDPDNMSSPVGGMEAWTKFLSTHLRIPAEARETGVNGAVYAEFIVDKEGKIQSPVIKKSLGMGLDDEALRIMSLPTVPEWNPAIKDGKAVNTLMTLPVQFRTDDVKETSTFFPQADKPTAKTEPTVADLSQEVEQMPIPFGGMHGNSIISSEGTLKEVVVKSYGPGPDYISKNTAKPHFIDISLQDNNHMLFRGKMVELEQVEKKIGAEK